MLDARVHFVLRDNYREKAGGDLTQLRQYSTVLREAGSTVTWGPASEARSVDADCYVLSNVDRVHEYLRAYEAVRENGAVVSVPIHHAHEFMTPYERRHRPFPLRGLNLLVPDHVRRERVKDVLRGNLAPSGAASPARVLRDVEHHVWIADAERRATAVDFEVPDTLGGTVVRNGVTPSTPFERVVTTPRTTDVLVVGRVESRKNVLGLAEVLGRAAVSTRFVGSASRSEPAYVARFRRVVERHPSLTWVGPVEPTRMPEEYLRARTLVHASWAETAAPLVEMEAALQGCWVIGSTRGYGAEYGTADQRLDPDELGLVPGAVRSFLDRGPNLSAAERVRDELRWSVTLEPLTEVFAAALG